MGIKNDLAAAIAKVASNVAAARIADQATIAALEAQLAGPGVGATDTELASMLDAVNAIDTSIAAPGAPTYPATGGVAITPGASVVQIGPSGIGSDGSLAPVAVVDRSALPFDPNAG
jgi:hypothetical protein